MLHRKSHAIGVGESLGLSAFYITIGLGFGGIFWLWLGSQAGMEYLTGFVVEKSLAMDNIFVIAMIFSYFAIPPAYQHRVLVYGILGVVILRAIMIAAGSAIITEFSWVLYLFAAFLVVTGIKMLFTDDKKHDMPKSAAVQFMSKHLNMIKGAARREILCAPTRCRGKGSMSGPFSIHIHDTSVANYVLSDTVFSWKTIGHQTNHGYF